MNIALTIFQGRAGDRNGLGTPGALSIGEALARRLKITPAIVGKPETGSYNGWQEELDTATSGLELLSGRFDRVLTDGSTPVTALPRCSAALATVPMVAKYHPDARIIWLDAHPDLNTPSSSGTGYLGGMVLAAAAGLWKSGLGEGLRLGNLILAGVRDIDTPEQEVIDRYGVQALGAAEADTHALREAIGGKPVYIHIDCDVFDPGIIPTEYQCPGGISLQQLHSICGIIAECNVIGVEIAEFQTVRKEGDRPASSALFLDALEPVLSRLQNQV